MQQHQNRAEAVDMPNTMPYELSQRSRWCWRCAVICSTVPSGGLLLRRFYNEFDRNGEGSLPERLGTSFEPSATGLPQHCRCGAGV